MFRNLALAILSALTLGACLQPEAPCQDMVCVQERAIRAQTYNSMVTNGMERMKAAQPQQYIIYVR